MDVAKKLFPESGKLVKLNEGYSATIVDAELDPIKCNFLYDECVMVEIEGYEYISLTKQNLKDLLRMIEESEALYEKEANQEA